MYHLLSLEYLILNVHNQSFNTIPHYCAFTVCLVGYFYIFLWGNFVLLLLFFFTKCKNATASHHDQNYTIKQRTAGEELAGGRFSRRSQGHDSSESEGEEHVPPPKRQKVQVLVKF